MATLADPEIAFTRLPHPAPAAADVRTQVLANPGFGTSFSDHMVSIDWTEGRGWHDACLLYTSPSPRDS